MKKPFTSGYCYLLLVACMAGCGQHSDERQVLENVMVNLGRIESASYHTINESWNPGDTLAAMVFPRFVKEYSNPADTAIGAAFMVFDAADKSRMEFAYDGKVRVLVYHEHRGIVIDDFTQRTLPFRPVSPPFFNYTGSIIDYALHTTDNIATEFEDRGDHWFFRLTIMEETQVEFFGRAQHMPENPYLAGEPTSIFEIWIDKKSQLPFRVRREMSHNISVVTCQDPAFNAEPGSAVNVYAHFPPDYEARAYSAGTPAPVTEAMLGRRAPDWVLADSEGIHVSLGDLDSRVLLIMITGIGCGPCQAAIPLLSATDEVIRDYQAGTAVPVFYILDENRIIRKVIRGYSPATTADEIMAGLAQWLDS